LSGKVCQELTGLGGCGIRNRVPCLVYMPAVESFAQTVFGNAKPLGREVQRPALRHGDGCFAQGDDKKTASGRELESFWMCSKPLFDKGLTSKRSEGLQS
jgi:hypothetical protein